MEEEDDRLEDRDDRPKDRLNYVGGDERHQELVGGVGVGSWGITMAKEALITDRVEPAVTEWVTAE